PTQCGHGVKRDDRAGDATADDRDAVEKVGQEVSLVVFIAGKYSSRDTAASGRRLWKDAFPRRIRAGVSWRLSGPIRRAKLRMTRPALLRLAQLLHVFRLVETEHAPLVVFD